MSSQSISPASSPAAPTPAGEPAPPPVVEKAAVNTAGQLVVHLRGRSEPIVDVRAARCFPWSTPENYISLRDSAGKEIVLLESLVELDAATREVIERELADKVFNPKIRHIVSYKSDLGVTEITADTDRGQVTFHVRSRDDVRMLSAKRALFHDADGNTYELPDLDAIDAQSRKWLLEHF